MQEALKTWRKRNAAMLLATQSIDDFASADLLRTVVESCPTRLLLANPSMDRRQYAELFQMNEMELDLLAGAGAAAAGAAQAAGPGEGAHLHVDPKSYWIYTNTPVDNERVAAVLARVRLGGRHRPAGRVGLKKRSAQMASSRVVPACRVDRGSAVASVAPRRGADDRHPRGDGDAIAASSRSTRGCATRR